MKRIKVLHRAATTGMGGVEAYVMNHYRFMDKTKFQFDFLTRNAAVKEAKEVQELQMGVRVFIATERTDKESLVKQINAILDEGYDAVHMNTSYWVGFLIEEIAMKRKIPKVIVHSHSMGIDQLAMDKRVRAMQIHESYKAKFGKEHATHFCACSKVAADWLFGPQIPREEIKIMHNAIEVEKYSFDLEIRKAVRDMLGIEECFVIGHVGRFAYQKNHEFLIDVFRDIYLYNKKARLLLIGQGELKEKINDRIKAYGIQEGVIMLNWREDVNRLMQAMDVFLLPSKFEGLPVALVEAQTAGLHCFTSTMVTKEAGITPNIDYLPLDKRVWVEKIKEQMSGYERNKTDEMIITSGYDIKTQAKELEKYYLS